MLANDDHAFERIECVHNGVVEVVLEAEPNFRDRARPGTSGGSNCRSVKVEAPWSASSITPETRNGTPCEVPCGRP